MTDKMTACRCFRYIAMQTDDPKIKEWATLGEAHAKRMADKIAELRKELDARRTPSDD